MRPLLLPAVAAVLLGAWPAEGRAQEYRFPFGGSCTGSSCYVTAYYDLDGSGGVTDWNCGANSYDGHRGTDFGVGSWAGMDAGRDVVAAADGEVLYSHDGEFDRCTSGACAGGDGYGNWVRLQHADGKTTTYGHLKNGSVRVATGDRVACGQVLGQVGSSGYSTGPHLHFEVRNDGGAADDPFTGPCGGPLTYWVDQGVYDGLPAATCDAGSAGVDDAEFVSETVPDGTHLRTGERFVKRWTMRNNGTTTWTAAGSYGFAFDGEEQFSAAEFTLVADGVSVAPGATYDWDVAMTAPATIGTYRGYWRMDRRGTARFGIRVWVEIVVDEWADADGDSYRADVDCNDADGAIHPGAEELCNGGDDDCDGSTDEGCGGEDPADGGSDASGDAGDGEPEISDGAGEIPEAEAGDVDGGTDGGLDGGWGTGDDGCGCALPGARAPSGLAFAGALLLAAAAGRRRRSRR